MNALSGAFTVALGSMPTLLEYMHFMLSSHFVHVTSYEIEKKFSAFSLIICYIFIFHFTYFLGI